MNVGNLNSTVDCRRRWLFTVAAYCYFFSSQFLEWAISKSFKVEVH